MFVLERDLNDQERSLVMRIDSNHIGDIFIYLFMGLIGLVIATSTLYKVYDYVRFYRQSIVVNGVITKRGCSGYFGCKPFIEYVDTDNRSYGFRSRVNFYFFAAPEKGDQIPIAFLKKDHQKAIVSSTFYSIIQPLYLFLIGVGIIVLLLHRAALSGSGNSCKEE